jgi:hypothetical protein
MANATAKTSFLPKHWEPESIAYPDFRYSIPKLTIFGHLRSWNPCFIKDTLQKMPVVET